MKEFIAFIDQSYNTKSWFMMAKFQLSTVVKFVKGRIDVAQVLQSLCYMVCTTESPKLFAIGSFILVWTAIIHHQLVAML